jgi:chromosome segregation ATPase
VSDQPVAGMPTAAVMSREQAEAAVSAAVAERDNIRANLLTLDGSFGKRLLAGAKLAGETKRRWESAVVDLTVLWELFTAYSAVVDRAAEILAHARRHSPRLAEITALLTGPSVRLEAASSPVTSRNLTGTGDTWFTLGTAVREMTRVFANVADVVKAAEGVWNDAADRLQQVGADLAEARRQASGFADDDLTKMLAAAEADLGRLRGVLNSDPLALTRPDHLDAARFDRLQHQTAEVVSRASELEWLRDNADQRIAAAKAAFSAARDARQAAVTAHERAVAKIAAAGLPPLPEVDSLAGRLATVDGLRQAGRLAGLSAELDAIEKDASAAAAQCREAEREAVALLDRRDELRGLLDGYRARVTRLGAADNADLRARYQRARALLWTAPCDLSASADAVTTYQQAVLALGRRP